MFEKLDGAPVIITGTNASMSSFSAVLDPEEPLAKHIQSQRCYPLRCLQKRSHVLPTETCSVKAARHL